MDVFRSSCWHAVMTGGGFPPHVHTYASNQRKWLYVRVNQLLTDSGGEGTAASTKRQQSRRSFKQIYIVSAPDTQGYQLGL